MLEDHPSNNHIGHKNSQRTYNLSLVLLQLNFGERLHKDLDEHHAILVPGTDTFHESCISYASFVLYVSKLRDVNPSRAGSGCRQRETLTHGE